MNADVEGISLDSFIPKGEDKLGRSPPALQLLEEICHKRLCTAATSFPTRKDDRPSGYHSLMSGSSLEIMICDLHPLDGGEYDVTDSDGFVWLFHTRVVEVFNLDEGRLVASETLMHAAVASSLLRARMLVRTILGRTRKPVPRLETDLRSRGIGEVDADCASSGAFNRSG